MLTSPRTLLAALLLLAPLSACGDDEPKDSVKGSSKESPGGECKYTPDGTEAAKKVDLPPSTPTENGKVDVTIETSVGTIKAVLDAGRTPCTVNNFMSLAKQDYYDNTTCHRLGATPSFAMLQCGDPEGTGRGGPGYTIEDELVGGETYPAGTLAMAKTFSPDSGGSQFFMVFEDTQLNPDYTVFGTMDAASIEVLRGVAAKGTDNSEAEGVGKPVQPVTFTDVK